jgi:hypothetical protein
MLKQLGLVMIYDTILTRFTEPDIILPTTLHKAQLVYLLSTTDDNTLLDYVRLQPYVLLLLLDCKHKHGNKESPLTIHSTDSGFVAIGLKSVITV